MSQPSVSPQPHAAAAGPSPGISVLDQERRLREAVAELLLGGAD
jgi:hypothetical protein